MKIDFLLEKYLGEEVEDLSKMSTKEIGTSGLKICLN